MFTSLYWHFTINLIELLFNNALQIVKFIRKKTQINMCSSLVKIFSFKYPSVFGFSIFF